MQLDSLRSEKFLLEITKEEQVLITNDSHGKIVQLEDLIKA